MIFWADEKASRYVKLHVFVTVLLTSKFEYSLPSPPLPSPHLSFLLHLLPPSLPLPPLPPLPSPRSFSPLPSLPSPPLPPLPSPPRPPLPSPPYSSILAANLDGTNMRTIVTPVQIADGLAVDWISKNIYWSDDEAHSIEVARVDGSNRRVIANTNLENPRGIAVHPHLGFVFI